MLRFVLVAALSLLLSAFASAEEWTEAEVRFTHPSCPARTIVGYFAPVNIPSDPFASGFTYGPPQFLSSPGVLLMDGSNRSTTIEGAYCTFGDASATDMRPDSVWARVEGLIKDTKAGDRIQISTFSFSNRGVADLLCSALSRGVELRVVYGSPAPMLKKLTREKCGADAKLVDGSGSGRLQHSKYILIERAESERASLSFQSANFSSGLNLHHENWTFVDLPQNDALFVKHLCHFDALFGAHFNAPESSLLRFREVFKECLDLKLPQSTASIGIDVFFVPARQGDRPDGAVALDAIRKAARESILIDVAAHHLTNKTIFRELEAALERGAQVRLLLDAELFWSGHFPGQSENSESLVLEADQVRDSSGKLPPDDYPTVAFFERGCDRGSSFSRQEYLAVARIVRSGATIRYVETNHREFLFFHNKFLVFSDDSGPRSVLTGAGNLSEAGFRSNGENYYFITEPKLVNSFFTNFEKYWEEMATSPEKLPVTWATEVQGSSDWEKWKSAIETTDKTCRH